jgi:hypothetical protein
VSAFPGGAISPRISAKDGRRWIIAADWFNVVALDLSKPHPIALGTDLWWNRDESGWGLSIAQHDNLQLFAVWFTYDESGKPTWRFVPDGTWIDATTFTGALYKASVPGLDFFSSRFVSPSVTQVGTVTLRFNDMNSGEATFMVGDQLIRQPITRMSFGPVGHVFTALADLYFNPEQSGWGFAMHQQYGTVFATWFLYDTDGSPTWLLMPDATVAGSCAACYPVVSGDVYRATSAGGSAYEARTVTVSKAGTASFANDGSLAGILRATIDGKSWSSRISPLAF